MKAIAVIVDGVKLLGAGLIMLFLAGWIMLYVIGYWMVENIKGKR